MAGKLVVAGEVRLRTPDGERTYTAGESFFIPEGVTHGAVVHGLLSGVLDHHAVAAQARDWMAANYRQNERGFVHVCRADLGGARSVD